MRSRPGQKQVNWWFSDELLNRLNEYRHEHRLDSLTEAARSLLEKALDQWEKSVSPSE